MSTQFTRRALAARTRVYTGNGAIGKATACNVNDADEKPAVQHSSSVGNGIKSWPIDFTSRVVTFSSFSEGCLIFLDYHFPARFAIPARHDFYSIFI